jgi:Domain of unknown function (DUF4148)
MKAVSNLVIALGFIAASGAAFATDRGEPTTFNTNSTLTRAEVRADAIAAAAQERAMGYLSESGIVLKAAPVVMSEVTRAEVRAETIAALSLRGSNFSSDNS